MVATRGSIALMRASNQDVSYANKQLGFARGAHLLRVSLSYLPGTTLHFESYERTNRQFEVRLANIEIAHGTGHVWPSADPDDAHQSGEVWRGDSQASHAAAHLIALLRAGPAQIAAVRTDGVLEIAFANKARIRALPEDNYEGWELDGPKGLKIISCPGGDLAIWT